MANNDRKTYLVYGKFEGDHNAVGSAEIKHYNYEEAVIAAIVDYGNYENYKFVPEKIVSVEFKNYGGYGEFPKMETLELVVDGFKLKLQAVPEVTSR